MTQNSNDPWVLRQSPTTEVYSKKSKSSANLWRTIVGDNVVRKADVARKSEVTDTSPSDDDSTDGDSDISSEEVAGTQNNQNESGYPLGHPLSQTQNEGGVDMIKWIIGILIVILIAVLLYFAYSSSQSSQVAQNPAVVCGAGTQLVGAVCTVVSAQQSMANQNVGVQQQPPVTHKQPTYNVRLRDDAVTSPNRYRCRVKNPMTGRMVTGWCDDR